MPAIPPTVIRAFYLFVATMVLAAMAFLACGRIHAAPCVQRQVVVRQPAVQVLAVPQVFYFIGQGVPAYTTQPQQVSDSTALYREFLQWRSSSRSSSRQSPSSSAIARNCTGCHTSNPEAQAAMDFSVILTPEQRLACIKAVAEGRMPKGRQIASTEAQAVVNELLEKENEVFNHAGGSADGQPVPPEPSGSGPVQHSNGDAKRESGPGPEPEPADQPEPATVQPEYPLDQSQQPIQK